MKNSMLRPCADWVERLAVRYPDDLSYVERVALNEHLASCPTCAAIHSAYQVMGARIYSLPPVEPLPAFPYRLLQREQCSAPYVEQLGTMSPGILFRLKSFSEKIYNHFHQRVIYVSSDDHQLYAIRNGNSSILWKYKNSQVFFSSPAVKNGVAYLTSFDAQIFLFRARVRPCGDSLLWR
jgi:hypothetical protein